MANRYQRQQERYFKQRTYDKVENYKAISKSAEKRIDKAIKEGKTPAQIAKREAEISANYAKTAARTDATRVENLARADAMTEIANMGVMMGKKWNAVMDAKTRDTHAAINGEEQFHDDPYSNGGMQPGDPNLPASERYNCRCNQTPIILEISEMSREQRYQLMDKINALTVKVLEGIA